MAAPFCRLKFSFDINDVPGMTFMVVPPETVVCPRDMQLPIKKMAVKILICILKRPILKAQGIIVVGGIIFLIIDRCF